MEQNYTINQKRKRSQRLKYILYDVFSVLLAWVFFFLFRRIEIESNVIREIQLFSPVYNFTELFFGIPFFWLFVFWLSGYYNQPFRKSRLSEFAQTLFSVFLGSLALFFILLLDDPVVNYKDYYLSFVVLFVIYFVVVYLFRYSITRITTRKIHRRILGFNTLIIGTGKNARGIYDTLQSMKLSSGHIIQGFISCEAESLDETLPVLGDISQLDKVMEECAIEEVIVALDSDDRDAIFPVINQLYKYNVDVRITPKLYDFLVGGVRMSSIFGAPLVSAMDVRLSDCEKNFKRLFDIIFSCIILVAFSPLFIILSLLVKFTSDGPVFYLQERIGLHGKPFHIMKFRTMVVNAEEKGPQLATDNDSRVTKIGHFFRKYRLDEIPQFINVLKGDMSIVGPRPERLFYEKQIEEKAPYYSLVHKVQPGITSWGMVKYGYANDVDKMVERLQYDIIYLENISLLIDLKILIYTIRTVVSGRGM